MTFLTGYKTYILGAVLAGAFFAQYTGLISQDSYNTLSHLLAPLGLITLRAAMK